jgi:hypothetical protein
MALVRPSCVPAANVLAMGMSLATAVGFALLVVNSADGVDTRAAAEGCAVVAFVFGAAAAGRALVALLIRVIASLLEGRRVAAASEGRNDRRAFQQFAADDSVRQTARARDAHADGGANDVRDVGDCLGSRAARAMSAPLLVTLDDDVTGTGGALDDGLILEEGDDGAVDAGLVIDVDWPSTQDDIAVAPAVPVMETEIAMTSGGHVRAAARRPNAAPVKPHDHFRMLLDVASPGRRVHSEKVTSGAAAPARAAAAATPTAATAGASGVNESDLLGAPREHTQVPQQDIDAEDILDSL